MADFRPLHRASEHVLFFKADASPAALFEEMEYRLHTAYHLLDELAGASVEADGQLVAAMAAAASVLLGDALMMSERVGEVLYRRTPSDRAGLPKT